jgi:cation transport ATPase
LPPVLCPTIHQRYLLVRQPIQLVHQPVNLFVRYVDLAPWGILLSPAVGALLMSLSTIIVAVNAQLLRRQEL